MWYGQQLVMLIFSLLWIGLQKYATWVYIQREPAGSPQLAKLKKYNLAVAITVGTGLSVPLLYGNFTAEGIWAFLFETIINGFIFWLVFDCGYGYVMRRDLWYLGEEANSDEFLKGRLGRNAGKIKAGFCIFMILVFELAHVILLQ